MEKSVYTRKGGHLSEKICIYAVGCNPLAKRLYIRHGKKSYGRVRNSEPKNVITTVRDKKFRHFPEKSGIYA